MPQRGGRRAEMAQTHCRTDFPADVEERSIIKKSQRLVGISIFNSMFVYEGCSHCHLIAHWKGVGLASFFPQCCEGPWFLLLSSLINFRMALLKRGQYLFFYELKPPELQYEYSSSLWKLIYYES